MAPFHFREAHNGDARDNGMGAAGIELKHVAGIFGVTRFAEVLSVKDHGGVGSDKESGPNGASGDEFGLGVGEAQDHLLRGLTEVGGLIDGGREHGKRDAGVAENLRAALRCRGEDQFHQECPRPEYYTWRKEEAVRKSRKWSTSIEQVEELQGASAAEGSDGEENEEHGDTNGDGDKPMGNVAGPSAKSGIKPTEGQNGKHGANGFEEDLLNNTPKALKAARRR